MLTSGENYHGALHLSICYDRYVSTMIMVLCTLYLL